MPHRSNTTQTDLKPNPRNSDTTFVWYLAPSSVVIYDILTTAFDRLVCPSALSNSANSTTILEPEGGEERTIRTDPIGTLIVSNTTPASASNWAPIFARR